MIEQQYYARVKGGLFQEEEYYDTVARSPQLKPEFIRDKLYPLCNYKMPSEEEQKADIGQYPPSFRVVPVTSGEMIVGQAVYKGKRQTGLSPSFFVHNLVLSSKEKRRYIKEPEKLFGMTGFVDHYERGESRQLPTLAALPYEGEQPLFEDWRRIFQELKIESTIFYEMIEAAFSVAETKKKMVVVLDVAPEQFDCYAKALLYHLYKLLPWCVAEQLGISTYSGSIGALPAIQIIFSDKKRDDLGQGVQVAYYFDLTRHATPCSGNILMPNGYVKMALKYAGNKGAWEKYNQLAEELSTVEEYGKKRDILFYERVGQLFEMAIYAKSGQTYPLDPKAREGLMVELLACCKKHLSEETNLLIRGIMDYAITLLHRPINWGILWRREEIEVLLIYKLQLQSGSLDEQFYCEQILLCLLGEAVKEKKEAYEDEVLEAVSRFSRFYPILWQALYKDSLLRVRIGYRRIEMGLNQVIDLDGLIAQLGEWEGIECVLLSDDYYEQAVIHKFEQLLGSELDKVKELKKIQDWCEGHENFLYKQLRGKEEQYFLEKVVIREDIPSEEVLCSLRFSRTYGGENESVIRTYQRLKTDISAMAPECMALQEEVQQLIRFYYRQSPRKEAFYLLVYAFLENKAEGVQELNLEAVLSYLEGISEGLMVDFIIWSKGQEMYIDQGTYDEQVIRFLMELEGSKKIKGKRVISRLAGCLKTKELAKKIISAQRARSVAALWAGAKDKMSKKLHKI